MAFYAGWPKAMPALTVAREVFRAAWTPARLPNLSIRTSR